MNNNTDKDFSPYLLFDASHIPMLLINPADKFIIKANKSALDFYGYTHDEIINLKISDINQLSEDELKKEIEAAVKEERAHFYFIHKLADGKIKDVEVHSGPININGVELLYSIIHDITERREAERRVAEMNKEFQIILKNTSDFIYYKDEKSRFKFCSQTLADITGHEHWEDMKGKHDFDVFPPDTARIYYEEEKPVFRNGTPLLNKIDPYYDSDGNKRWVSTNKWPVFTDEGDVSGIFGISRDITDEYLSKKIKRITDSVFDNLGEGVIITDKDGLILDANKSFSELSGYNKSELVGEKISIIKSDIHDSDFYSSMWSALFQNKSWEGDIWNKRKDGSLFVCDTKISAVFDDEGIVENFIGTFSDITDRFKEHEAVSNMALKDHLTGLSNRFDFTRKLDAQIYSLSDDDIFAVCFIDLDKFKYVNDNYGHESGDYVLKEISNRIVSCIRNTDVLSRFGGDEFCILISGICEKFEIEDLLCRVISECSKPIYLEEVCTQVNVSASIGVSFYPDDGLDSTELIREADKAMYRAKENGRNQFFYAFEF